MQALQPQAPAIPDLHTWDQDRLAHYILATYHVGVLDRLSDILQRTLHLAQQAGGQHASLNQAARLLTGALNDLGMHFHKEEAILFPYIHSIYQAHLTGQANEEFHCGSVQNPISVMLSDHDGELLRFATLLALDLGDAQLHADIQAFATQLQEHIYLENSLLFPRAIEMEGR